jgi:hypothetical protein
VVPDGLGVVERRMRGGQCSLGRPLERSRVDPASRHGVLHGGGSELVEVE